MHIIVHIVVSIEFSPLSTVELTTNWYQLHNGDYQVLLEHSFGKQLPTNFLQSFLAIYKPICPVRILKRVGLDAITRSVQGKFNCISVNFDRTQHGIHIPLLPFI